MSLVSTASLWTNDDNSTRKRQPSMMRKTIKKPIGNSQYQEYSVTQDKDEYVLHSMEDVETLNKDHNSRVNDIINKMSSASIENDGEKLADFNPPPKPNIQVKKDLQTGWIKPDEEIPNASIEWAAKIALECRRRVKEQQKKLLPAEFRNTQFSFHMGDEGVEQFVGTPELHHEDSISDDPLPPGQAWVISPGGDGENPGLFRIDVNSGPGSGVKILNQPTPPPLKESIKCAEQNLYARAKELVGDREPRDHEFSVQVRAFDSNKTGQSTGIGILLALCSSLIGKSLKGGLATVGGLNLGGSIEPVHNPVSLVEIAADKGAKQILMPLNTRKLLNDLPDEVATRVVIIYYSDARDALIKALGD
jgi:predicted ATP-dependent Lon-type protease